MLTRLHFYLLVVLATLLTACSKKEQTAKESAPKEPVAAVDTSLAGRYFAKAGQYAKESNYDSAMAYLEKARVLYEADGDWESYIRCGNKLGEYATEKGRYEEAKQHLERAAELGASRLGEQHPELANSYNHLGVTYWRLGDYDQSLIFHDRALSIRLAALGRQHPDVARSYLEIGRVLSDKGDLERGLSFQEKALAIYLSATGEQSAEVADTYNRIAINHGEKGDLEKALEYFYKALAIWQATYGDQHLRTSFAYNNIGIACAHLGKHDEAIANLQKGLSIKLNTVGEKHITTIQNYSSIGQAYNFKGDYEQALAYNEKALALALAVLGERHPVSAFCYDLLGDVHQKKGDLEQALKCYEKTLVIRESVVGRQHYDVAETSTKIADIYLEQGHYEQALNALQSSISANIFNFNYRDPYANPPLLNILSESRLLVSLERKALAFVKRYAAQSKDLRDLKAGVSTYELAIRLMDNMRSGYKAEASKLFLANTALDVYDRAIQAVLLRHRTLGEPQDLEKAFLFAEKSKGGILLEALSEAQARQFANIPDSLLERERQLQLDLALYDRKIIDEQLKGETADSNKISQWRQKMFAQQRAYETLLQQFEKDYHDYYNLKYQVRNASVKEVQEQILDERTAIVEYFTGKDSIFIFVITPNGFRAAAVARDSSFERQVEWLRRGIVAKDFSRYASAARDLHQTLLKPVAGQIEAENLIIIPDGAISGIPFETLLTKTVPPDSGLQAYSKLPYLANDHAVSYAYSATLLLQTLKRKREEAAQDYLAFAPVFAGGLPSGTRSAEFFSESLGRDSIRAATRIRGYLPVSREEVRSILNIFENHYGFFEKLFGNKSRAYFEQEANEKNIKSPATAGYRYVHFATHGFVNEKNPKLSGLILEQDERSNEDGILHLGEIYNLNLNADLVVLSACETGLGQVAKGEGIIGLTRGFLYAGASNLLVSLWQVSDATTADLMVDFYGKMLAGMSKAEALREAKLQMIRRHAEYAKPYYWAPFILVGK